jgi:hypothetical protein
MGDIRKITKMSRLKESGCRTLISGCNVSLLKLQFDVAALLKLEDTQT